VKKAQLINAPEPPFCTPLAAPSSQLEPHR
jgi:hypothetical protein